MSSNIVSVLGAGIMKMHAIWTAFFILYSVMPLYAYDTTPRISDREIIESLAALKEEQKAIRAEIAANKEAIAQVRQETNQLRQDMVQGLNSLRHDMNLQFDRMYNIFSTIIIAFSGIVAATIGFAVWDRRTMIRPFETKVRDMERDLMANTERVTSLFNALRALSETDTKTAEILRRFNLL